LPSCHSVQSIPSFPLLSKSVNIKIHGTIILPAVLYAYETCSLTLQEEQRAFENGVEENIERNRDEMITEWRSV
jgi:hypothetical protein